MTQADLSYLLPLFELARGFLSEPEGDARGLGSFGLGETAPTSSLAKDDEGTQGYWVSGIVAASIGAAP